MGKSNAEQFLPSKELATISALAQGYSDYKKRLEEKEMAKQAQRAELLKVILPLYLKQRGERAIFERERPLDMDKFQLEQQKVAQTGQLGIAGLQVQMTGLENAWNIANMQELGETGRADARNNLSVELERIRASVQGMIETNKAGIARAQITSAEKQTTERVAGRAADVSAQVEGRADVSSAVSASREKIAKWHDDTMKEIAKLDRDIEGKFPEALKQQVGIYKADAFLASEIWTAALVDPKYKDVANLMTQIVLDSKTNLNTALAEHGGVSMPARALPELEVEKYGGFLGIGQKERTVPALIPGLTPTRGGVGATGLEVQGPPEPMQLPALKTSGTEFDKFVSMMKAQNATFINDAQKEQLRKMGIDPDAVERAVNK